MTPQCKVYTPAAFCGQIDELKIDSYPRGALFSGIDSQELGWEHSGKIQHGTSHISLIFSSF